MPTTMPMTLAIGEQALEAPDIDVQRRLGRDDLRSEVDDLGRGRDQRVCGWRVMQGAPELSQRLAEVAPRGPVRRVRPEQGADLVPRSRSTGLDHEVRQQGPHLGVLESRDRRAVDAHIPGAEQGDGEAEMS